MNKENYSFIYEDEIEEIHSFDAYYKDVVLRNNHLLVPYINLGVSNHTLNRSDKLMFLDFSYMMFQDVCYLDVFLCGKRYKIIDSDSNNLKTYHFGGAYLDHESYIFNDMSIRCKHASLIKLPTSRLSELMWNPLEIFSPDMKNRVNDFFDLKELPKDVAKLFF